jgi:transcriptional regulator with XRE-family HTH domain
MLTERRGLVASTGNPTARRRELGNMLRAMRLARDLTVEEVAESLLVSPSKVSRVETGQRGATARDIRDLAALYQLDDDERQLLDDLAAGGKQRAWWQPFNLPYSIYVGLEADAVSIHDFALAIVPGLLQTPAYAMATLRASYGQRKSYEELQQMIRGRVERQRRVLYAQDTAGKEFWAVIDESVLQRVVGGPDVMSEQVNALAAAAQLPDVRVRIVPFDAGPLPVVTNKFIILGFGRPTMPDVVYLESFTGELVLDQKAAVEQYTEAFDAIMAMSLSEDDTLAALTSIGSDYRSRESDRCIRVARR